MEHLQQYWVKKVNIATSKACLHPKKIILYVWWDWKGILYYEILPNDQSINLAKYCLQLDELKISIQKKTSRIS